jgi:hypothetical protein
VDIPTPTHEEEEEEEGKEGNGEEKGVYVTYARAIMSAMSGHLESEKLQVIDCGS